MLKPLLNLIRKRPILAIFEVCLRCNSACGYCDLPLNKGREELTREEIRSIFSDLYAQGIRFVFLQGGEPLVRRDLIEIIRDLHEIGLHITLITNGTRLSEKLVSQLKSIPVHISISLDTLDRDKYKLIRGADQLPEVLAGMQRLQDYPHPKFLTCIVTQQNLGSVDVVTQFAKDNGFIPVVGAYHWGVGRYGRDDPTLKYQRTQAVQLFERLLATDQVPKGYYREYLKDNVHWLSGGKLNPCDAGRYSIAIDSSGNVAPCLALPHGGNLLESSLTEILDNFDQDEIHQCSDRSSCNMVCSRIIGSVLRKPTLAVSNWLNT